MAEKLSLENHINHSILCTFLFGQLLTPLWTIFQMENCLTLHSSLFLDRQSFNTPLQSIFKMDNCLRRKDIQITRHADIQIDIQIAFLTSRQTSRQRERETSRQTEGQTDTYQDIDIQAHIQIDRHISTQTHRHPYNRHRTS